MEFFISFIIAEIVFIVILFFTAFMVQIKVSKNGVDDSIQYRFTAWFGLINIKAEIPLIRLSNDLSGTEYKFKLETPNETLEKKKLKITPNEFYQLLKRIQNFIKRIHNLHHIAKLFLKHLYLKELKWKSKIGTGEAAETGFLTGMSWGIKSNIIGFISAYLSLHCLPKLSITPDFDKKRVETHFQCMIRFRLGNAIVAGIRILLNLRKRRDEKWQNTQFRA